MRPGIAEGGLLGATLGHYSITDRIGAGGMGEVFRAKDTKLGPDVAIKVLPAGFEQDSERLGDSRGLPEVIVVDNGPEFTSRALRQWAYRRRVRLHYRPLDAANGRGAHNSHNPLFLEFNNRELTFRVCLKRGPLTRPRHITTSPAGEGRTTP